MAGRSLNSFGSKNFAPGPPATRYNVSGKNREFYTYENAPGIGAYATGGTIIDGGDGYIYHIFTGTGTFAVNRPPAAIDSVDYSIVAGGGAIFYSGGGGGGGLLFGSIGVSNSPGSYPISLGGGASNPGSNPSPAASRNGSPSTAFGLTAAGGGGGGGSPNNYTGGPGGSGGGGGGNPGSSGGTGNIPATIPRQGYTGGFGPSPGGVYGGGGGGAGGLGTPATPSTNGLGGPGRILPEFPSSIVRKAIPAPLLPSWEPLVGPGGYAAGGSYNSSRTNPANSGYGGGYTTSPVQPNNSGGSGIVCIRYKKTAAYSRATGGTIEPNTHPEHPGVWRHIFTSPGTFTISDPTLQYIDYTAVGGGGGGGAGGPSVPLQVAGGGGGAGGFVSSIHTSDTTPTSIPEAYPWNPGYSVRVGEQYPVSAGSYPIGIGTGGNGGSSSAGSNGTNTTIGNPGANQIIAVGGGGGAYSPGTAPATGSSGGSGGGGSKFAGISAPVAPGGAASPSPLIQGNTGGSTNPSGPVSGAGGGGGAGAIGSNAPGNASGAGGIGQIAVLCPTGYGTPGPSPGYRYVAGGGGGASALGFGSAAGGSGGGGAGGTSPPGPPGTDGTAATTNTGGGGGGAGYPAKIGGAGGPGIVIIQYPE